MGRQTVNEFDPPIELPALPPLEIDGKPNVSYYTHGIAQQLAIQREYSLRGKPYAGLQQHVRGLTDLAELHGVNPKHVLDSRNDAQIYEETMVKLMEQPSSLFEMTDKELDAIEKGMNYSDSIVMDLGNKKMEEANEKGIRKKYTKAELAGMRELSKTISNRIQRVRRLRERARTPIPKGQKGREPRWARQAAHVLRFMLYVGRTQTKDLGRDKTTIFNICEHHGKMALADWVVKHHVCWTGEGPQKGIIPYEGLIIAMPPAHGKTEFGIHAETLDTNLDPERQMILLHASGDKAREMKKYMASAFTDEQPVGRRNRALFPMHILAESDNTAYSMRLRVDSVTIRAPTVRAHGLKERASGGNCTHMYIDDPVDESERYSDTDREKTVKRLENTWFTRLRGRAGYWRMMTTLWHSDDAVCRKIRQAHLAAKTSGRKGSIIRVLKIGAGGPDKQFKPVWKEAYPASYLRRKYQAMGPIDYSVVYECDPASRDAAIIKKLALYPTTNPDKTPNQRHSKFIASCSTHLSIDPAGTSRKGSAKAGVIYAGLGQLQWNETENGSQVVKSVSRLRVLQAFNRQADQSEIVEWLGGFALSNPIHYVYVETVGGYAATADMIEERLGIDAIRLRPAGNASKEIRLRQCQVLLEDTHRPKGVIPPVEFPGKWEKGTGLCGRCNSDELRIEGELAICVSCDKVADKLIPDDNVVWLIDQISRFGTMKANDGVDALTQLILYHGASLGIGQGAASEAVKSMVMHGNQKKLNRLRRYRDSMKESSDPDNDDYDWHSQSYRR